MNWFRIYIEAKDDPKLHLHLSDRLFRRWFKLMCIAAANEPRGFLPDMKGIAFGLQVSLTEAEKTIETMLAVRLVDRLPAGDLIIHGWDKRQFESDTSTERVKRFRERSKTVPSNVPETPDETDQRQKQRQRQKKKEPLNPQAAAGAAESFSRFWEVYPRKTGKLAAERAWNKAVWRKHPDDIQAALERQIQASNFSEESRFQPHPATWLNAGSWDDALVRNGARPLDPASPEAPQRPAKAPEDLEIRIETSLDLAGQSAHCAVCSGSHLIERQKLDRKASLSFTVSVFALCGLASRTASEPANGST